MKQSYLTQRQIGFGGRVVLRFMMFQMLKSAIEILGAIA